MTEAVFTGASGKLYRFFVMRPDAALLAEPAVYAFARPGPGLHRWTPVFLSRTANLAARVAGHERWPEARLLGATHVLAWFAPDRALRESAEADLLSMLRPAMHVSLAGLAGAAEDAARDAAPARDCA
jgi:hypothetical protein